MNYYRHYFGVPLSTENAGSSGDKNLGEWEEGTDPNENSSNGGKLPLLLFFHAGPIIIL